MRIPVIAVVSLLLVGFTAGAVWSAGDAEFEAATLFDILESDSEPVTIGTVNGASIEVNNFESIVYSTQHSDGTIQDTELVKAQVVDRLIRDELFAQEAVKRGLFPDTQETREKIRQLIEDTYRLSEEQFATARRVYELQGFDLDSLADDAEFSAVHARAIGISRAKSSILMERIGTSDMTDPRTREVLADAAVDLAKASDIELMIDLSSTPPLFAELD